MHNAERALDVLIHDLRAPLSVAQGYLRLVRENRLESPDDRDRAIASAMDALGRISGLCADASAYLQATGNDRAAARPLPAGEMIELVRGRLASSEVPVNIAGPLDDRRIRSCHSLDRLADAVARVVAAVLKEGGGRSGRVALDVAVRADELQLAIGPADARVELGQNARTAFDAWRGGHGLALPLACLTITDAGGRIWQLQGGPGAAGIAFPVEAACR